MGSANDGLGRSTVQGRGDEAGEEKRAETVDFNRKSPPCSILLEKMMNF